ncbi:MAG: NAD-dependent epimerase/dehydratase family protein [Cyclobacteriaceae bacterium]|nr:NAD-dependent epimerase/dehydratase family protein [Cyclobacteriaceae bacterium]
MTKVLVIGACGQLGFELTLALRKLHGSENVIASDIRKGQEELMNDSFEVLDAMNKMDIIHLVKKHNITQIYHLAAVLSAKGEKNPGFAWDLNMGSLSNVLEVAKEYQLDKIYWPSSIAVFGPNTPQNNTPQNCIMDPNTVYGITKQAGERWCEYYFNKYGVDVRSLRYPGLIGYKTMPGGGTTDYAVDIYYKALQERKFECFLSANTALPMMYMDDAVKATIDLMQADASNIKIHSSYNISAISFTPEQISTSIKKYIPDFEISYKPDFRQNIADSWPNSIDDSKARNDWGWYHQYDLDKMTEEILKGLKEMLSIEENQ